MEYSKPRSHDPPGGLDGPGHVRGGDGSGDDQRHDAGARAVLGAAQAREVAGGAHVNAAKETAEMGDNFSPKCTVENTFGASF